MPHVHVGKATGKSLPIVGRNVRFAVGTPTGRSSNSWLIETRKTGDIYIICRDNFSDSKVSLHASGKWRSVIFIEPHQNPQLMTVVQLVVAPVGMAFDYGMQEGGTIADLQVTEQLHAIVNVVFEDTTLHNKSIIPLIDSIRAYEKIREIAEKNASAIVLPSGFTDLRTMFLTPLPLKSLLN